MGVFRNKAQNIEILVWHDFFISTSKKLIDRFKVAYQIKT